MQTLKASTAGAFDRATKRVEIFAPEDDYDAVLAALRFSDYSAHWGDASAHRADATDQQAAVAAFVGDTISAPIDLCRSLAPRHPVILLSSRTDFAFRLEAARAGVKIILKRPVDPIDLLQCLEEIDPTLVRERLSVVLVDDDRLAADLNAEILTAAGIDVEVANEPAHAVEVVERVLPDLVLMDLRMPGVDGMELTTVIRLSRQLVSIPIVFLSVERDGDRQSTARRLGGDDFIQKPIDPKKLIALVKLRADRAKTLRVISERDGLTGLLDHSRFRERLAQAIAKGRQDGREHSLAIIDVDRFKAVNDHHGHLVGDQILRTLARLLTSSIRKSDIAGRCGGEEFGILLHDIDSGSARTIIDRIRERFANTPFQDQALGFNVTFSAGIASSRDCVQSTELFVAADRALYDAKRSGRNLVRQHVTKLAAV